MSTQPRDCIYCGQHANSREHVWLAGLGGRRTNKGILCSACNAHFAELDALLISQLALIRGLIGVRPDHDSVAAPGRVTAKEGVLMLDSAGRPSWLIPRLRSETPLHDGTSFAIVECEGEAQIQQWRQTMRERGIDARPVDRDAGARFIEQPVQLRWSFGGDEAFREIARLVLNVIADLYPRVARLPGLQPIKQWIWGERATELPVVWFNDGSVALPPPVFAFGHRVALRFDEETGEVFAVVSFFNAFEYIVALGAIGVDICVRVIVEVGPLVERPPGDRAIVEGEVGLLMGITQPSSITVTDAQRSHLSACTRELGERIVERQARVLFSEVLPQINAVRELPAGERGEAIREALRPCNGYILRTARLISARASALATEPVQRRVANAFASMTRMDASSDDGLTEMCRNAIFLAGAAIASVLERELFDGPITLERLTALLNGELGMAMVLRGLLQPVLLGLGIRDDQFSC